MYIGESPLILEDLTVGEHWLRITPDGCEEGAERQTFFFTVPPSPSTESTPLP